MRYLVSCALITISFFMSSCALGSGDIEAGVRKLVPDKAIETSDLVIEFYIEKNSDGLKSIMQQSLAVDATEDALNDIYSYLSDDEIVSTKIIGGNTSANTATGVRADVIYEIEMNDGYLRVFTRLQKNAGQFQLWAFSVESTEISYADSTAFSFANKTPIHFAIFGLAVSVPVFILVTLIACIRRKNMKRKILWTIFILFGLSSTTLNWNTGSMSFSVLYLQFFGAGFLLEDAWYLSVGIPLGAILWWIKYRPKDHSALPVE